MSQDVGQRLKIKIQRLKIKIECLKIKTKKGLLMVWWRPLPSPAPAWAGGAPCPAQPSQPAQPASLEASPEVAPPLQPAQGGGNPKGGGKPQARPMTSLGPTQARSHVNSDPTQAGGAIWRELIN